MNHQTRVACFVLVAFCSGLRAAAGQERDVEEVLRALATYRYGESRELLVRVEQWVGSAADEPELRARLASGLVRVLQTDGATVDGKRWACRQLARVGTSAEVPALAALLEEEALGEEARSALERIPGDEALAALRGALARAQGLRLIGFVNSLGERRDEHAVSALAGLLSSADRNVVAAALGSLGKIGTSEAAAVLSTAERTLAEGSQDELSHALLACAGHLADTGAGQEARVILLQLCGASRPASVRAAAFKARFAYPETSARRLLLDALRGTDEMPCRAALGYLGREAPRAVVQTVAEELTSFAGEVQAKILELLVARGLADPGLLETIAALSSDREVRREALLALFDRRCGEWRNLARDAVASSPDALEKDGDAAGDQAAIDGNPATYWDEEDDRFLYRLVVSLPPGQAVSALAITGFNHHDYAPRDFDVLVDSRLVASVREAAYRHNRLWVLFPGVCGESLELRVTKAYGRSPAIRELEIYAPGEFAVPEEFLAAPATTPCPDSLAIPAEEYRKIEEAVPGASRVAPKQHRKLLVFSRSWGYKHSAIPYGAAAIEVMARKTGAFEAVFSDDAAVFETASL
ncbi:MAG: HEAT repeat domain-containing protein, partial [Planctomycetota bacterium]